MFRLDFKNLYLLLTILRVASVTADGVCHITSFPVVKMCTDSSNFGTRVYLDTSASASFMTTCSCLLVTQSDDVNVTMTMPAGPQGCGSFLNFSSFKLSCEEEATRLKDVAAVAVPILLSKESASSLSSYCIELTAEQEISLVCQPNEVTSERRDISPQTLSRRSPGMSKVSLKNITSTSTSCTDRAWDVILDIWHDMCGRSSIKEICKFSCGLCSGNDCSDTKSSKCDENMNRSFREGLQKFCQTADEACTSLCKNEL